MNYQLLLQTLGKDFEGPEVQSIVRQLDEVPSNSENPHSFDYFFEKAGIGIFCERQGKVVRSIFLYNEDRIGETPFQGELPGGASFAHTREDVRLKLGSPQVSGVYEKSEIRTEYDLYEIDDIAVYFEFDVANQGKLLVVTLSRFSERDIVMPQEILLQLRGIPEYSSKCNQLDRAHRVEKVNSLVRQAYHLYDRRMERLYAREVWLTAVQLFRKVMNEAYPPGFWEDVQLLKQRDGRGLETAVKFLELDPWFFRSGYTKETLLRYIVRMNIPFEYIPRLQAIVINAVILRDRREMLDFCWMAKKVDSPEFRSRLENLRNDTDPGIARRANWVLEMLDRPSRYKMRNPEELH